MQQPTRSPTVLGRIASLAVLSYGCNRTLRKGIGISSHAVLTCGICSLLLVTSIAFGQQQSRTLEMRSSSLPDAPLPQSNPQTLAEQVPGPEGAATVSGTVDDSSGAAIPGALVSVARKDGTPFGSMKSDDSGEFSFSRLPAGSYVVTINAKGFEPFASPEFLITPKQDYEIPAIALSVAATDTEITVRPTDVIAAEQIKAEEKQRVFGIVPNFLTSYTWDAAPLTTEQKYSLATHDTLDPVSLIGVGLGAGIQQALNTHSGYGQGAAGYGKRFAALFADGRTSDYLGNAVFPSLFHQDPRYFYQGSGSTKSRVAHALSYPLIARSDTGKSMPNYSYFLALLCSGAISNAYYPSGDRGVGLVFSTAAIGMAGRAGGTVIREFLSKRVTTNVPGGGKP